MSSSTSLSLVNQVARELSLASQQVAGALALFEEGNTLPFIARYRKEATGALDEQQLRDVHERAMYLVQLEERRGAILRSVDEQGKLTDELRARIASAATKQALEDLYLPYKPKRRTRATIAREHGLEPLAELIWSGEVSDATAHEMAAQFVVPRGEVPNVDEALAGARDILAERIAEDAEIRGWIRDITRAKGSVRARAATGREREPSKFQDYYDFAQRLTEIPSHRVLAIRRGEEEGILNWTIEGPAEEILRFLEGRTLQGRRAIEQLRLVIKDAYKRLIAVSIEVEIRLELTQRADEDAITIFGQNLEQLLLAAPAGERVVLGLDPGFRTGVKAAVVSKTGALLETETWFLHQPDHFTAALRSSVARHNVELIAIGNGTASRETETLVRASLEAHRLNGSKREVVLVNEAGASVYSASELAREELPALDVSLRGAVSIARRLQDPLAELVKIDPKAIGVGQYQHDVNQPRLKKRLEDVVASCVHRVGVEVNTASASLLSYVSGIGPALASNIVRARDERGGFRSRRDLLEVPRLGAKAFEQAAGFLRIRGGTHPLDATAVHPERYGLVERIATDAAVPLTRLMANEARLAQVDLSRYVSEGVGLPTLQDILGELRKPGRDPRLAFEAPAYRADVTTIEHLHEGMQLDGVVTNIVAFGAFVDIGVHQDGLVHLSQLADRYVKVPTDVVRVGQRVKVRVVGIDRARKRIALSMRAPAEQDRPSEARSREEPRRSADNSRERTPPGTTPKPGFIAPNGMRFK